MGSDIKLDDINRITLDLSVHRIVNVHCKVNDTNTRKLFITIANDGTFFPLDSSITATYKINKGDGTVIYNPVDEILDDGRCYIDLTPQCIAFSGISQSEIQLIKDDQIISTMPFNIIVHDSEADRKIESSNEFKVLLDYMSEINNTDNKINNITNEVLIGVNEDLPDYLRSGDFYLQEY